MTAEQAAIRWRAWRRKSGTVGPRTLIQDRDRTSRFVAAVGYRPLGPAAVRVWTETLGVLAPASRRAHASTVRTWLRWCEAEGLACKGTAATVPTYKAPTPIPRALSRDEVDAVCHSVGDERARLAIELMLGIGLRLHEVARLTTDDVDTHIGTVLVRGKGAAERILPLPDRAAATVQTLCRGLPAGAPLFSSVRGLPLTSGTLGVLVRRTLIEAGVKRGPRDGRSSHCLRHTCASEVLEAGHPLHVVRELLGHRSIATTSVYLRRVDLGALRAAVAHR